MPFPVIAAITLGISAYAVRDDIRRKEIAENKARREKEDYFKSLKAYADSQAKPQTVVEMDKQLPIQQSLLSQSNGSYDEPLSVQIAGTKFEAKNLLIGGVVLIMAFLIYRSR